MFLLFSMLGFKSVERILVRRSKTLTQTITQQRLFENVLKRSRKNSINFKRLKLVFSIAIKTDCWLKLS